MMPPLVVEEGETTVTVRPSRWMPGAVRFTVTRDEVSDPPILLTPRQALLLARELNDAADQIENE